MPTTLQLLLTRRRLTVMNSLSRRLGRWRPGTAYSSNIKIWGYESPPLSSVRCLEMTLDDLLTFKMHTHAVKKCTISRAKLLRAKTVGGQGVTSKTAITIYKLMCKSLIECGHIAFCIARLEQSLKLDSPTIPSIILQMNCFTPLFVSRRALTCGCTDLPVGVTGVSIWKLWIRWRKLDQNLSPNTNFSEKIFRRQLKDLLICCFFCKYVCVNNIILERICLFSSFRA